MSKERPIRRIQERRPFVGGAAQVETGGTPLPPAMPTVPPPEALSIEGSPTLTRSAVTATARVRLRWRAPIGLEPERYLVQWSTDNAFTSPVTGETARGGDTSATVPNLPISPPGSTRTIWFRVAAQYRFETGPWSNVVSAVMPADNTPPNPVSALTASFLADGALRVAWQTPTSDNFRAVELRIWNGAGKAVEYDVIPEAGGTEYRWPAARNRQQTVGSPDSSPDPAVFIEARAVSWGNAYSTIVSTSATKAPPANISGLAVDFSGPDAIFTCNAIADSVAYEWTIDGRLYTTSAPAFTYTYAENQLRHSGTAVPSLPYSIRARDALDQRSAAATAGTAINAAPAATTIAAQGIFATIALTITPSAATDLRNYRVRVYKDTLLQGSETFFTAETSVLYTVKTGNGSYTFDVTVYDIFDQPSTVSALSTAQQATDITQFVADLRADALYSEAGGSRTPAQLKEILADDNTGTSVLYQPNANYVNWTQVERPGEDRYRVISLQAFAGNVFRFYVQTSQDGVNWRYFSGPLTGGRVLTEVANETDARTAAILDNAYTGSRVELPGFVLARYVRIVHRNANDPYRVATCYPRRLVQGDDMEAESVTTVNLAAFSVVGDKIAGGAIDGKTITGAIIRTAASGARVELDSANGIRNFDGSGNVLLQLQPGNGLSVAMTATTGYSGARAVTFVDSSTARAALRAYLQGSTSFAVLSALDSSGIEQAQILVKSDDTVEIRTGGYPIVRIEEYPGNILLDATVRVFNVDTASTSGVYRVGGTQVLRSRRTGWGSPTGTATRTAFDTGSVTLAGLAQRVKALIDDLRDHHGALGA